MTRSLLRSALVALVGARGADSFVGSGGGGDFALASQAPSSSAAVLRASPLEGPFAVGTAELDEDLSEEEKAIINVYRSVGPSVAFVTSTRRTGRRGGGKRSGRRRGESTNKKGDTESKEDDDQNNARKDIKPDGTSLGSGSGFVVSEDGYLITNHHVIKKSYDIITAISRYNSQIDRLVGNATASLGTSPLFSTLENRTKQALRVEERPDDAPRASVYVRINSSTKYKNCRIVDVRPDLDVAVLKVELRLHELREYRGKHGNCKVPQGYEPNPSQANWVMTQRRQYRLFQEGIPSEMNDERINKLEGIDFEWDPNRDIWKSRLHELREYWEANGDCNVPNRFKPNPSLGSWVTNQRQQYRLFQEGMPSSMTKERINKLEGIDFEWDGRCYG